MNFLRINILVFTTVLFCGLNTFFIKSESLQENFIQEIKPVIILGGGISGLSAGICLKQEGLNPIIIEGSKPGGELIFAQSVRNWPGKKNLRGVEVVDEIRNHARSLDIPILEEEVIDVDLSQRPYKIKTRVFDNGKEIDYFFESCIIAMGSEPSLLGIKGESGPDGYFGQGVNTCVWCDGPLYQDSQRVAVIGGGQGAIFNALHMADIAQEVVVIVKGGNFAVSDTRYLDRLLKKKNVKIFFNMDVLEIKGNGQSVTHVVVRDNMSGKESDINLDGIFLAVGSHPKTSLFKDQIELGKKGEVILKNYQETSKKGIFAAGEICQNKFSQAIVSASQGCVAALQVKTYLQENGVSKLSRAYNDNEGGWDWNSDGTCKKVHRSGTNRSGAIDIGSTKDFDALVMNNSKLVVLDFYSPYCPACKYMMPVFDELAETYRGKFDCIKVNMVNTKLNSKSLVKRIQGADIASLPTFIFVKNGKEVERITRFKSKDDLRAIFARYK